MMDCAYQAIMQCGRKRKLIKFYDNYIEVELKENVFFKADIDDLGLVRSSSWSQNSQGYAHNGPRGKFHRQAMNANGRWNFVDHINGDRLDNRKANLRLATPSLNSSNRSKINSNNSTGFHGVNLQKGKYTWSVRHSGQRIRKSGFDTAHEAAEARNTYIYSRGLQEDVLVNAI